MSEILTEFKKGLPSDWYLERIERLSCSCRAGGTPSRGEKGYWKNGTIPFAMIEDLTGCGLYLGNTRERITTAGINASSAWIVPPGAVLVSMYATVGETAINRVPMATNQAILAIRVLPEHSAEYLAYCISYFRNWLLRRRVESTQKNISKAILTAFEIPVPPLHEQRQIATVLSAVQRAIDRQKRLIALTAELKKALMHKLFTEGTRREPLKQTGIGPLPRSWAVKECNELCSTISVGVVVKPRSHYVDAGVPAFRSFNVREDRLVADDLVYFSPADNSGPLSKSKLRVGDVLIVRTGYPGTACVVPTEFDGANCIDLVFARPGPLVESAYLSRFFNSGAGRAQATASSHGLAQQHLNVSAVKRVLVPLPTLEEQREIAECLADVDRKSEVYTRLASALSNLFRALLHNLMSAEVRVHDLDLSALGDLDREPAGAA